MLFDIESFDSLCGFDERFFMYVEDVDLCARVWQSGRMIYFCSDASVIHVGQRASHRRITHFVWHCTSMLRYFRKFGWFGPKLSRTHR